MPPTLWSICFHGSRWFALRSRPGATPRKKSTWWELRPGLQSLLRGRGLWFQEPQRVRRGRDPGPRSSGRSLSRSPRPGAEPSWEPRRCPDPGQPGPRRARRGRGLGLRGCGAQRKGLVPACGAGLSGAAESGAGSSGGGRLAGGGVKAPARGKTLSEAGRAAAGTLLRGRGSEAL